jgi:hypothetical protein
MKNSFMQAPGMNKHKMAKESSAKDVTTGASSSNGSSKFVQAPGMSKNKMAEGSVKDMTGGVEEKSCDSKTSTKIAVRFIK